MDAEHFARIKACHDTGGKVSEEAAGELIAEVERLRAGIEKFAADLQGLGHETPWKYGRELRALIEQPLTPESLATQCRGIPGGLTPTRPT